jgi:hypothetical protein
VLKHGTWPPSGVFQREYPLIASKLVPILDYLKAKTYEGQQPSETV